MPPPLVQLFKGLEDRIAFESLKDYALNEMFRRDVYVKGRDTLSSAAADTYLDSTPFGTLVAASRVERRVRLPHYTLELDGPMFDVLLPAIAERPRSGGELARLPALSGYRATRVRDGLRHLLFGEQVAPLDPSTPPLAPVSAERCRVALAHNRRVLGQMLTDEGTIILVSPAAGTGLIVPLAEAIWIRLVTEVEPQARGAWLVALCKRMPFQLRVGERSIEDTAEKVRYLEEGLSAFCAERLPKLVQLGVLEQR